MEKKLNSIKIDGVELATSCVGFKYKNRKDYFIAKLSVGASVAGVFTLSKTRSSAVDYSRRSIKEGNIQLIVGNSGNANAFTGKKGEIANENLALLSKKIAQVDGNVVTTSTGVIGEVLDNTNLEKITNIEFNSSFVDCAKSIMTTDTFEKISYKETTIDGTKVKICGIAKGSGMVAPNMATVLGYIFTDAKINNIKLNDIIKQVADISFNLVTVDGDTSTSDSLIIAATGQAQNTEEDLTGFIAAVKEVAISLAKQIARDGEGASKFITVNVKGAIDFNNAKKVAMSIANSPLVKTAIAGQDANWGRIVMAIGKSGAEVDRDKISIAIGENEIAKLGEGVYDYNEDKLSKYLTGREIEINVDINLNNSKCTVWTCDLTHDYISINADYRS